MSNDEKDNEIKHKDDIIKVKDEESRKGWKLLKTTRKRVSLDVGEVEFKSNFVRLLESAGISVTVSGFISGITFTYLDRVEYPASLEISLLVFTLISIPLFIMYFINTR